MTKSESISIFWKKPENADCFFGQALGSGSSPRVSNLEAVGCNDADLTQPETFPTARKTGPGGPVSHHLMARDFNRRIDCQ
jgi:hypothetical protein